MHPRRRMCCRDRGHPDDVPLDRPPVHLPLACSERLEEAAFSEGDGNFSLHAIYPRPSRTNIYYSIIILIIIITGRIIVHSDITELLLAFFYYMHIYSAQ